MKKLLIPPVYILFLFFISSGSAIKNINNNLIYMKIDTIIMPEFPATFPAVLVREDEDKESVPLRIDELKIDIKKEE